MNNIFLKIRDRSQNFFKPKIISEKIFSDGEKIFLEKIKFFIKIIIFFLFILLFLNPSFGISEQDKKNISYEIVFGIDNSLSMLAKDGEEENRFQRAKNKISEIINSINGEFGLLEFSGESFISIPFTTDKTSFLTILSKTEVNKNGNSSTRFDSIKKNLSKIFDLKSEKDKIFILLSDGENQEEGFGDLDYFKENKIRILTIGFGKKDGSKIFLGEKNGVKTYKKYEGKEVLSFLNEDFLEDISKGTGGKYFNEKESYSEILNFIEGKFQKKIILEKEIKEKKYFQFFAFLIFLLILIELFMNKIFIFLKKNLKKY